MSRSVNTTWTEIPVQRPASSSSIAIPIWFRISAERTAAVLLLLVMLPLLILLALVIKMGSPGPVLFRQSRLGYRGQMFTLYKLRTMYEDNEGLLTAYLQNQPELIDEWQDYAKIKGYDPRVTPVGRWIRKFSLNEIPQLINVIKGDMCLIGPRPYLPDELPVMGEYADTILSVNPGITGLWQVSGRNEIPINQRVLLEAWYVKNRNWRLDALILAKTIPAILSRRGAF